MNFVIGDIHGEFDKLTKLIGHIKKIDNHSELIFIGDYLDKGKDSKSVLDFLISLEKTINCTFLIGNHEYYWINGGEKEDNYLLKYGGKKTIESFNCNSVNQTRKLLLNKYQDFFNNLLPYLFKEKFFISHSGFKPDNNYKNLSKFKTKDFLFNRYDFIKNQSFFQNKYTTIFGHTAFISPYVDNFKIGIDTGACFSKTQPLTAFCIEKKYFVNSNNLITSLSEIPDLSCPAIIRTYSWLKNLKN